MVPFGDLGRIPGLRDDLSARTLFQVPDIVRRATPDEDTARTWPLVAKALAEAIRQHDSPGSEAHQVTLNYNALSAGQKQDLLNFLRSL